MTTYSTDDLTPLIVPTDPGAMRQSQGRILTWDPETFENTVDWRGITLTNVPVKSGVDALTYQPGDVVTLVGWAPSTGGVGSWWIDGRLVIPGAGRGEQAIAWMTGSLARALAGDLLHSDLVETAQNRSSTSFGDLATVGPSVTLEAEGRALVTVSARVQPNSNNVAVMSFEVSGASSLAPSTLRAVGGGAVSDAVDISASRTVLVENLNPGSHTFTAKYASINAANAFWSNRVITVQPF